MTQCKPRKYLSGVTEDVGLLNLRMIDSIVFKHINNRLKIKESEVLNGRKRK